MYIAYAYWNIIHTDTRDVSGIIICYAIHSHLIVEVYLRCSRNVISNSFKNNFV